MGQLCIYAHWSAWHIVLELITPNVTSKLLLGGSIESYWGRDEAENGSGSVWAENVYAAVGNAPLKCT